MYVISLSFLTAFALTYFAIPSIIHIARTKHLYDEPGERSSHQVRTPSLGGVGIFAGAIFSIVLWTPFQDFGNLQYILCALLILFLIGAKDDISPVSPTKKLVGQIMAAAILAFKSGIRLDSLYGLFWYQGGLPEWLSVLISIFTILVITNAFNLIDGINGLAGSVSVLIAGVLGSWFFATGYIEFATMAFAMVGATLAFLKYNYSPAQLFMGDTGSLILGLVSAILAIKFIDCNFELPRSNPFRLQSAPAVAIGVLIIPLFDTLRVFTTRILRGRSPFEADRRHIHHLLIDYGYTHMHATGILVTVNIFYICLVLGLDSWLDLHELILLQVLLASAGTYYLHRQVNARRVKSHLLP
jgi:UDP-N-acetylmuramyl pentapeptide phosphotransferase/UDP-N-acetylglucosamine-1-phosphate transferase